MPTSKVSNRAEASRVSGGNVYRMAEFPGKKRKSKELKQEKLQDFFIEEKPYQVTPKKGGIDKKELLLKRKEAVLSTKTDIQKALEKIGVIQYYV